jgi:two-component system chemotaxis sensor kinase CheA
VRRAIPLAAVDRIEAVKPGAIEKSAGRLHVSLGERILPLLGCGDEVPGEEIRAFLLSDGERELALGFADVVDIVPLGTEILPAAAPGMVRGVTLIGGEQVELIDLYWLFENEVWFEKSRRPICVMPAGDPWMDQILRPIVESAGYQVVIPGAPEAEEAAVSIVNADSDDSPVQGSGKVVRIRSDASAANDGSIHRYDRAALLGALAEIAAK